MRSSHSLDRLDTACDDDRLVADAGPTAASMATRVVAICQAMGVRFSITIRQSPALKYRVGLNHLPSGKSAANGAWLAIQGMAHNLARWTARLGLVEWIVTTKTLRRRLFGLAGRITRSARRVRLHLPARWPWAIGWRAALVRLRAIPLLA